MAKSSFLDSIKTAISLIPTSERWQLLRISILQILLSFLDLAGVILIGALGSLAVRGVASQGAGDRVSQILSFLRLDEFSFQGQITALGILAVILLTSRSIFSFLISRKTIFIMAKKSAKLSSEIIRRLFNQPLLFIEKRPAQETVFSVTTGVNAIMVGLLANILNMVTDFAVLIVLWGVLFFVDPLVATSTAFFFGVIFLAMSQVLHKKARQFGVKDAGYNIKSNQLIMNGIATYRESFVRGRIDYEVEKIGRIREQLAKTTAELTFLPSISKYVIEISVVLGAFCVSAVQFLNKDAYAAIATLSVFLAASTRIAPSAMRIQQGIIQIQGNIGIATSTILMIEEVKMEDDSISSEANVDFSHDNFEASIKVTNLNFSYPDSDSLALDSVSLRIDPGDSVAIVGQSGAGKTTLIDLLLGVLPSMSGEILISQKEPREAIALSPGAIAYVPQEIVIVEGTVRENVALGYPIEIATDERITAALEIAQLMDFASRLPLGFDSEVGDRGTRLSGGERQRLGIARALFSNPKLIVLDEASSSLDAQTEAALSNAIQGLKGKVSVILVAHRLSTVQQADQVIYLESGRLIKSGTFDEVRKSVPGFDKQAKLMGL
jgi:ABC-type multidrug transport system fused ATPase/permease subunit